MYVIAGLGNPRREYDNTRHNVGFAVIDMLAEKYGIRVNELKHRGLIGKGVIAGECIREVLQYYRIDGEKDLIVIHDDISLEQGMIRIRKKGSAGGHNGLKNIIAQLGSETFMRIKVGVGGKPEGYDLVDYVLGHFSKEERERMAQAQRDACSAVEAILTDGADEAMNRFNGSPAGAGGI